MGNIRALSERVFFILSLAGRLNGIAFVLFGLFI